MIDNNLNMIADQSLNLHRVQHEKDQWTNEALNSLALLRMVAPGAGFRGLSKNW